MSTRKKQPHEARCPKRRPREPLDTDRGACECQLIRKTRADERERIVAEYSEWPEGVPAPEDSTEYLLYLIARVRASERAKALNDPGYERRDRRIEAEVRERIAQAIEAHAEKADDLDPPPQQDDYYAACHDAAAIARGDT